MRSSPDLPQKTVIITGGNSGLGYSCAKAIAKSSADWHIVLACRNPTSALKATEQLIEETQHRFIEPMLLDLASLSSIRAFVQALPTHKLPPLHALVCNAGVHFVDGIHYTNDGFEMTFGVNHLGHFLLTHLLLSSLVPPARIAFVSSDTHDPRQRTGMPAPQYQNPILLAWPERNLHSSEGFDTNSHSVDQSQAPPCRSDLLTLPSAPLRLPKAAPSNELRYEAKKQAGRAGRIRYTTSKLCNILCTYELARRLVERVDQMAWQSLTVNAFNPSLMPGTGLARHYPPYLRFLFTHAMPSVIPLLRLLGFSVNTADVSGQHLARLILDPTLESITGKYFSGLTEIPSSDESYDRQKAIELWERSVELVGLQITETLLSLATKEEQTSYISSSLETQCEHP